MSNNRDQEAEQLLNRGAELAGSAVGGAIGFLAGGVLGATAGAALGTSCGHALKDIANRMLSSREQVRVGATGSIALQEIHLRLEQGQSLRSDDFFTSLKSGQRKAEEVFEGILLKAKDMHEEKKIVHIGKLFANIAFDASCSVSEANHIIGVAEALTYTQYCLLHIYEKTDNYSLRDKKIAPRESITYHALSLLQQTLELFRSQLVLLYEPGNEYHTIVLELNQIIPKFTKLSVQGKRIYEMLDLAKLPAPDITEVVKSLDKYL